MEILFDHNVSRKLRPHFSPHVVTLTKEKGWDLLENGELLEVAQHEFDVKALKQPLLPPTTRGPFVPQVVAQIKTPTERAGSRGDSK